VGTHVLAQMAEKREGVVAGGQMLMESLHRLHAKFPRTVCGVSGTGLLVGLHIVPEVDVMSLEPLLRKSGLNVIHGGENALRMTPWFGIDAAEVEIIEQCMSDVLGAAEERLKGLAAASADAAMAGAGASTSSSAYASSAQAVADAVSFGRTSERLETLPLVR